MKTYLSNITLYTSALCNLSCKYCFIHKNKYLQDMENLIIKDCDSDYYLDFMDKLSNIFYYDKIHSISLWGGEPTIGMKRFYPIISKLCKKYTTINNIKFSSNFVYDKFEENFIYLFSKLSKEIDNLLINAQISIDGPEWINDSNRGIGVTKRAIESFNKILDDSIRYINEKNITFSSKGTITIDQMKKIIESNMLEDYFDFYYYNFASKNKIKNNIRVLMPTITLTLPGEYSKQDGLIFAEFCEKGIELAKTGKYKAPYGDVLIPYKDRIDMNINNENFDRYNDAYCFCGLGAGDIGLLPNHMISLCHREFATMVQQYKEEQSMYTNDYVNNRIFGYKDRNHPTLFPLEMAEKECSIFRDFKNKNSTALNVGCSNLVRALANLGQINSIYKNEKMALFGAKLVRLTFGVCAKDCQDIVGTCSSHYSSAIKLMLNGADKALLKGTKYEQYFI